MDTMKKHAHEKTDFSYIETWESHANIDKQNDTVIVTDNTISKNTYSSTHLYELLTEVYLYIVNMLCKAITNKQKGESPWNLMGKGLILN